MVNMKEFLLKRAKYMKDQATSRLNEAEVLSTQVQDLINCAKKDMEFAEEFLKLAEQYE